MKYRRVREKDWSTIPNNSNGHFMSSQTTYAPHVPNLAQFFHIYWSSYEFSFPNFVCS